MRRGWLFALTLVAISGAAQALEIRIAPPDTVFLNDTARRIGVRDVMLQNIAIVNDGNEEIGLQRMDII